jgi:hypothetical protein
MAKEWPRWWVQDVISETFWSAEPTTLTKGHCVAQIRLILLVVPQRGGEPLRGLESFLAYVEHFDIVPQPVSLAPTSSRVAGRNPATQIYVLKCASRAGLWQFGDIIPLSQLRGPVQLVPCFGEAADSRLTVLNFGSTLMPTRNLSGLCDSDIVLFCNQ